MLESTDIRDHRRSACQHLFSRKFVLTGTQLPSADNWAFQVEWCPRNPDLLATAFFDGTIGIHSIQSTNEATNQVSTIAPKADGADIFDPPSYSGATQGTLSLKQPPKWLRRPTSSSFGFGGKLVTVSNLPSAQGKHQSGMVHITKVVTESDLVERARKLQAAIEDQSLNVLAEERSQEVDVKDGERSEGWKALLSLFMADSRDELVTLLGYSKVEVGARVAEAIAKLKDSSEFISTLKSPMEEDITDAKPHEPVVSFAEPEPSDSSGDDGISAEGVEKTPSEISASASETPSGVRFADGESTTTAPSLFGDDNGLGTLQTDAAADFFSTMGLSSQNNDGQQVIVPHHNYGLDSSVAATIGSGPSSVNSDSLKNNTFRIYPSDESETDQLVTKALVLGDFESAVSLCLSSDRFADAILLAAKGGSELLARTQKAYFERRTMSYPYLRLFQSIVTNDLADIVQNADLQEWQEIFVVLCTFASPEEFPGLTEQLGRRLEFQFSLAKASDDLGRAYEFRKNATLTYLAAGRLERLINIWIEELVEEERYLISDETESNGSRYTAHAHALQTFIEKVTVFRSAISYVDGDLDQITTNEEADVKTYKLSTLYDRYFEYADLLATQGFVKEAVAFLKLTPSDYRGSAGAALDFVVGRERLLAAAGSSSTTSVPVVKTRASHNASGSASRYPYGQYAPQVQPRAPVTQATTAAQSTTYQPYNASTSNNTYAPAQPSEQPQYQSTVSMSYNVSGNYNTRSLTQPPHLAGSAPSSVAVGMVPPPPPRGSSAAGMAGTPPAPPPKRRENGGWNDAPAVTNERRGPAALTLNKPAAIVSPFPNSMPSPMPTPGSPYQAGQQTASLPPPPRPGSVQARQPPLQAQRIPPPPQGGSLMYPPPGRPPSGPPGPIQAMVPPSRLTSPPQNQGPPRQITPSQYGPSQTHGPPPGPTSPPRPYSHLTPPPGPPRGPPGASGPYPRATPPPVPQQQGSYAGHTNPPGPYGPPPDAPGSVPPAPPSGPPRGPPVGPSSAPPSRMQRGPPAPKYRES